MSRFQWRVLSGCIVSIVLIGSLPFANIPGEKGVDFLPIWDFRPVLSSSKLLGWRWVNIGLLVANAMICAAVFGSRRPTSDQLILRNLAGFSLVSLLAIPFVFYWSGGTFWVPAVAGVIACGIGVLILGVPRSKTVSESNEGSKWQGFIFSVALALGNGIAGGIFEASILYPLAGFVTFTVGPTTVFCLSNSYLISRTDEPRTASGLKLGFLCVLLVSGVSLGTFVAIILAQI